MDYAIFILAIIISGGLGFLLAGPIGLLLGLILLALMAQGS